MSTTKKKNVSGSITIQELVDRAHAGLASLHTPIDLPPLPPGLDLSARPKKKRTTKVSKRNRASIAAADKARVTRTKVKAPPKKKRGPSQRPRDQWFIQEMATALYADGLKGNPEGRLVSVARDAAIVAIKQAEVLLDELRAAGWKK